MKPTKTSSVQELQTVGRFEGLRRLLLCDQRAADLDKPLAHWALPTDRRLPLALLGRTLRDLLNTPFAELAATRGVGEKKLRSFVRLLARVANTDPVQVTAAPTAATQSRRPAASKDVSPNGFDPSTVSELVWARWQATVVKHGLESEALGRFAPSLKRMTRVAWNRPLADYTDLTLAEIRSMKTHGQKRVHAILEVFYTVHHLLAGTRRQDQLVVRILPRMIDSAENWIGRVLQTPGVPRSEEIFDNFVQPLLEQIRIDASEQIVRIAEHRLGIDGPITSVRQIARTLGLTRARVYQLLNEINDIMNVRWPLGRHQVYELLDKLEAEATERDGPADLEQLRAAIELFYPGSRRGAAGRLTQAAEPNGPNGRQATRPSCRGETAPTAAGDV